MPIHVSDQQLDQMENGRTAAVIVRSEGRKKGYALIPERVYARLRPLFQFMAIDLEPPAAGPEDKQAPAWAPACPRSPDMASRNVPPAWRVGRWRRQLDPTRRRSDREAI